MNTSKKLKEYLKIKNTKNLFLLVSLFFNPSYALTRPSYKSVINNPEIKLTKNKIIFEEKFFSQNDTSVLNNQDIKFESDNSKNDIVFEDLEEEVNRTIFKKNINKFDKIISENESNVESDNTPPSGKISVGEFLIPPRGYINLKGPEITINLVDTDALETLKLLAKSGNYGFLYIDSQSNEGESDEKSIPKITASFTNQEFSRVFNSLLMASNLQAKFEEGIIVVGENIFNKSLDPKYSKTYRINQASASSVGDYLSTLGARI